MRIDFSILGSVILRVGINVLETCTLGILIIYVDLVGREGLDRLNEDAIASSSFDFKSIAVYFPILNIIDIAGVGNNKTDDANGAYQVTRAAGGALPAPGT